MRSKLSIRDKQWFKLQFDPAKARAKYGIALPSFPDDATQISFTGLCGRENMQQAFNFYLHVLALSGIERLSNPRIMDFGAGWGRIARLFLREARPQDIVAVDTMGFAIEWLRKTGNIFRIVQNAPTPPIPDLQETFHLIYAYSVFSHLSEKYACAWLDYLLTLLQPGGHLVITTRGDRFIRDLIDIKAQSEEFINSQQTAAVGKYLQQLRETFPDPAVIRQRFEAGEFQFFPISHTELGEDCTGETIIPKSYFQAKYAPYLNRFDDDMQSFSQSVIVLKRPVL